MMNKKIVYHLKLLNLFFYNTR